MDANEIKSRLSLLFKGHPEVLFAYLYGSYAKGTQNELSDVDVAVYLDEEVISSDDQFNKRLELIGEAASVLDSNDVEVVILNNAPPLLRFEVIKFGFVLDSKDEAARVSFHVNTFNEYMDYSKILDTQYAYMKMRLKSGLFGERLWKRSA